MNTADITCIKVIEDYNKNNTQDEFHKTPSENKSNWYDRVYLCCEDTNGRPSNSYAIKGFGCYRYDSFENADYGWNNCRTELHKLEIRHIMIPMCRWVPEIFDKYILGWKLKKCIGWKNFHKPRM